jgi:hypothetical protein
MPLDSIDDVLSALDTILQQCWDRGSRLGYFPALYRKVTRSVKDGIARGEFENGPRMEELDILFAGRYLDAWDQYQRGQLPSRCWLAAFEAGDNPNLLVIQHLLLGMNAHINLDLGVSAARVSPGPALAGLENDFNRINTVLAGLVGGVKAELETVWPPLKGLDVLVGSLDDRIVNFSMQKARGAAWALATHLSQIPTQAQLRPMANADDVASALAFGLLHPGLLEEGIRLIRREEHSDVRQTIDLLM